MPGGEPLERRELPGQLRGAGLRADLADEGGVLSSLGTLDLSNDAAARRAQFLALRKR